MKLFYLTLIMLLPVFLPNYYYYNYNFFLNIGVIFFYILIIIITLKNFYYYLYYLTEINQLNPTICMYVSPLIYVYAANDEKETAACLYSLDVFFKMAWNKSKALLKDQKETK
ncbi:hypothetical protein CVS40_11318 [Lucilia cuprina]|nr:hypothetical protein CVS40_11318 [Lucilia cuprina]